MKTIHNSCPRVNMVTELYQGRIQEKELEIRGVGYRAQLQDQNLFWLLVNHTPDEVEAPEELLNFKPNNNRC